MDERTNELRGSLDATGMRFGIVAASFNDFVVDRLLDGAISALLEHGATRDAIVVARVPGAFELPLAIREFAVDGRYDALVALGCVIRGETPHFDYVAGEASRGLTDISLKYGLPVGFGLLTTDTVEQAAARAGGAYGNKGADAALAALEMASLLRMMEQHGWA
jgi:6,7-dimethyl-8-ribityllumazine synthase